MALGYLFVFLLLGLTLYVHGVKSLCNVTCSTDYYESVNCSCTGSLQTNAVFHVHCRDGDIDVTTRCGISPLQSWCVMHSKELYDVAVVGTTCTTTVLHKGGEEITDANESLIWNLSDMVKPQPPFDVEVTNTEKFINISWKNNKTNELDCLEYTVRVRESKDLLKDPAHHLLVGENYVQLDHKKLQSCVNYTVDVKAQACGIYNGPWSEWSSTAAIWTTRGTANEGCDNIDKYWWYPIPLSIGLALCCVLLLYSQKPYLQRKFQLITYIPRPDEFFKPLHDTYGGNFKEWVKPVFSERDYLRISPQVQMKSKEQHDVLQWHCEKESYRMDNQMEQDGHPPHMLQPHSNPLLFFQDSGSSEGTGHSTGHISIHTVTLSGEEEFEEEVASQGSINTLRSYQNGEGFGSFAAGNREHGGCGLAEPATFRLDRQSGVISHHENHISNNLSVEDINFQPHVQLVEPERVSLASFASNVPSEDGYPHVDLDTIDSGFGECSSPGASHSNIAEQIDSFHEHKGSNSNYVKQWMIHRTIREDSGNIENEHNDSL